MFMKRSMIRIACALLAAASHAHAQTPASTAPASVSLPVPVMSGPLTLSPAPPTIDPGPLGTWYVDGAVSALGVAQTNSAATDHAALADISNGQVFVQKIDGLVRFYVQLGAYALTSLGQAYQHVADTSTTIDRIFGPVPHGFIKIPIERGLLWAQEPAVSRGVQANYITGLVGFSLSLNDGFYSGRYNWLSGSASWTIDAENVLVFAAGANFGQTSRNDLATPIDQNNSSVYNLIYTYTRDKLMISPYVQYNGVAARPAIGIDHAASLFGAAMLATYAVRPDFVRGGPAGIRNQRGRRRPESHQHARRPRQRRCLRHPHELEPAR